MLLKALSAMLTDEIKAAASYEEAKVPSSAMVSKDYYLLTKDKQGECTSFCFSNSESDQPYYGFASALPEYFKKVVRSLIEDQKNIPQSYEESVFNVFQEGQNYSFLITAYPSIKSGQQQYNFLIRLTDSYKSLNANLNKQLVTQKNLNKLSYKCISSVSHDFRTPLSIIYANIQLLEYHENQLDQQTIEDAFTLSRMAVKSLLRVLDKVTVVDSINKGRLEFKPTIVNLKALCENLVKGINEIEIVPDRVRYVHDDQIADVEIDEYLFLSMFTHLILNGLAFSKKDYKVLFVCRLISDEFITFTVKDLGIGISDEQLKNIKGYFSRTDSEVTEGIGLGFAIVKECLTLQNGTFEIKSEQGKGTSITINLPIVIKTS